MVALIKTKFLGKTPESIPASFDLFTKADNTAPVFNCFLVMLELRRPHNLPSMEGTKMMLKFETHRVVKGIIGENIMGLQFSLTKRKRNREGRRVP